MIFNIVFCPCCGKRYKVKAEWVRPDLQCTSCLNEIQIPSRPRLIFEKGTGPGNCGRN